MLQSSEVNTNARRKRWKLEQEMRREDQTWEWKSGKSGNQGVGIYVSRHLTHHGRSYQRNCTLTRQIQEVKPAQARPVVRWVTTCEALVTIVFAFFFQLSHPCFFAKKTSPFVRNGLFDIDRWMQSLHYCVALSKLRKNSGELDEFRFFFSQS